MFSSRKLFALSKYATITTTTTTTTTTSSPDPLSITVQPQNETVTSGLSARIGEATWQTNSGFARSDVIWERRTDGGSTWSWAGTSKRQDESDHTHRDLIL